MGRGADHEAVSLLKREDPLISNLPIDITKIDKDAEKDLLLAIEEVLLMDPLPPGEEKEEPKKGSEKLPPNSPSLIGISGRPRAGKDAIAEGILLRFRNVERINFSDMILEEVNDWLKDSGHRFTEENKSDSRYRHLLQAWGMARRSEKDSYWTDSIKKRIKNYWDSGSDLVLVCGVRALSDLEAVESLGGEHWRVIRPANAYSAEHDIEKQLDDLPSNRQIVIENSKEGDLDSLHKKVYQLLES